MTLRIFGNALIEYTNWVIETNQSEFLLDIGTTHQYVVDQHDNPVLLDIEPGFYPTIDSNTGKTDVLFNIMRSDAEVYASL